MHQIGFDWQFVVVTLAALCGGLVLLRPLWQLRGSKGSKPTGACGRCSSPGCTVRSEGNPEAAGLVRLGSGKSRKPGTGA